MPVTTLAPTVKSVPHAASGLSSRNGESGSTSSSMRSRGVSLPRAWCRSTYLAPPPAERLGVLGVDLGQLGGHRLGGIGERRRSHVDEGPEGAHDWNPKRLGGQGGQDLGGAAADAEDAHVAVLPLDLGLGHVTHAAEQLNGRVGDPLARLDGGVLREAHLGDQIRLTCELPLDQMAGVHPGHVDASRHLGQRVLHRLTRDQRPAKGFPVTAPLDGEVKAALRAGVGLCGQADAFGHEGRRDLQEARVLRRRSGWPTAPARRCRTVRRCRSSASPSSPACA